MDSKGRKKYSVIFFLIIFFTLYCIYFLLQQTMIRDQKTRYQYLAINESNYIISCIDKVVVRTYMMREMIVENDGGYEFFDKMSDTIYRSVATDTGVNLKNIAIAPDSIVTRVYPLGGNESFVGFDYSDTSKLGNKEAVEAYSMGKTIITNPFELMQGGIGMSIRTPVYIKDGNDTKLWGMVSATMDFDNLLHAFNLDNLTKMNLDYRLWYTDDNGEQVVIADTGARMTGAISESFEVYNLKWNLDIEPKSGWFNVASDIIAKVIILFVSFCLTLVIMLILRIREDGQKMKLIAEQDSLTHCYSRHYLNSVILDTDTANWRNLNNCYSLAIIDVDFFKSVNDNFGHSVGDMALVSIAKILQKVTDIKKSDCVVRYGGDEFIICFNDISQDAFREKIISIVDQVRNFEMDSVPDLKLSVSIGAMYNNRTDMLSYNELIQLADNNLYKVKQQGRDGFCIN